jgi:hypothetical protein
MHVQWLDLAFAVLILVAATSSRAAPAPATAPVQPDVLAMTRAIEQDMTRGDGNIFDRYFDKVVFTAAATRDVPAPLAAQVARELPTQLKPGREFKAALGKAGSYHLLRIREVNGSSRALFRVIGMNGLDYHDLVLGRDGQSKPCFIDVYVFVNGETMSQTMGRAMRQIAAAQRPGEPLDPYTRGMMRLGEMRQLVAQKRGAEALNVYNELPAEAQAERSVQIVRLAAARQTDESTYQQAMDDFVKRFKGDASIDLIEIDQQFIRGKFDAMSAAIDRLDRNVGGDPYLDVMRGSARLAQNDLPGARQFVQKAAAAEPDLVNAYDAMLNIAVKQKDHAETARLLALLEKRFGRSFGDLASAPQFAAFVQSPEYQAWLKRPQKATR